jgi:hypothetical protein
MKVLMKKYAIHFLKKIVQLKKNILNLNKIIIMLSKMLFYWVTHNKLV